MDISTALLIFGDLLSVLLAPLALAMAAIALGSKNFREEYGNAFSLTVASCALLGAGELFLVVYTLTGLVAVSLLATVLRLGAIVLLLQVIRVKLQAGYRARKAESSASIVKPKATKERFT
jgi:hypothetical protein